MARYKRYTYVVVQTEYVQGSGATISSHSNLSVHPSPKEAKDIVDGIIGHRQATKKGEVRTDKGDEENVEGYPGEVIREVFIDYPDQTMERFRVERWFIWYGKA